MLVKVLLAIVGKKERGNYVRPKRGFRRRNQKKPENPESLRDQLLPQSRRWKSTYQHISPTETGARTV